MRHYDIAQNSPEWYMARAGVATSSAFDRIVTKTGKASTQADKFANEVIAELILGRPIKQEFSTKEMEWGHQHESDAIAAYEFLKDCKLERGGFFTNDARTLGASPDARVGNDGLVEIKCPYNPAIHVEFLLMQEINPIYKPQVQGQLLISERDYVDWFSYHPDMPHACIRTGRDEEFIAILEEELAEFEYKVQARLKRLVELGHIDDIPTKEIAEAEPIPDTLMAG